MPSKRFGAYNPCLEVHQGTGAVLVEDSISKDNRSYSQTTRVSLSTFTTTLDTDLAVLRSGRLPL